MNSKDKDDGGTRLRAALLSNGSPMDAASICERLQISQPTFSRRLRSAGRDVIRFGAARSTQYAVTRTIGDLGSAFPIYEVQEDGSVQTLGELRTLHDNWNVFLPADGTPPRVSRGIPFFLQDLRPQGFMGRLLPLAHKELLLPEKITDWGDDDTLRYVAQRGENVSGNLVVGGESYRRFLTTVQGVEQVTVKADARAIAFAELAERVNQGEAPGSSAGGEQPKFTAAIMRDNGQTDHVIVKFSAPIATPNGRRWGDMLIAEHLSMETLRSHGISACASEMVMTGERVYLEVVRFDRIGLSGRAPIVSMAGLDCELGALDQNWTSSTMLLRDSQKLSVADWESVRLLEVYGALIGNSDRHPGNLTLHWDHAEKFTLAPAYDMLPMMYQPNRQGEVVERNFDMKVLDRLDLRCLPEAATMAIDFWERVQKDGRISADFKQVAKKHVDAITMHASVAKLVSTFQTQRPVVVTEGVFSGLVLSVANGIVTQKINRDGKTAVHDFLKLSVPVAPGEVVAIKYINGIGVVARKDLGNGVDR